jgi:hypothetical protein
MKRNMTRKPMPYEDVRKLLLYPCSSKTLGSATRGAATSVRWPIEDFWHACNVNLVKKGDSR